VAVIVKHRDRLLRLQAQRCQAVGQHGDALFKIFIRVAMPVAVNNLAIRRIPQRRGEQFFDDQRIPVIFSGLIGFFGH
jgi:hypothetical protein